MFRQGFEKKVRRMPFRIGGPGQMLQKRPDLHAPHVRRMPFVVKQDEPAGPIDTSICRLRPVVMFKGSLSHLLVKARPRWSRRTVNG
jgi:hypothetical protein